MCHPYSKVLVLLTNHASLDVVCYPLIHVGPPILLLDLADCLIPTRVSGCGVVVH